ncbi:MAG: nucleoside hydrolase [Paludibacter sp.]
MRKSICIYFCIILFSLVSCKSNIEKQNNLPVPVIFDTDVGNDIDDVLALQMLLNYESVGLVKILGLTVSKSNLLAPIYADGYNRFNNKNDIPIGYVYEGPNKDLGRYIKQTLDTLIDGKKILFPLITVNTQLPEAFSLQRKLLSEQEDNSVVLIAVGPHTNLRRLIESEADEFSDLNGVDLVAKKVNRLVLMGGNFDRPGNNFPEWNIVQDIRSSQILFEKWPTKIIVSGFEIGQNLLFPHQYLSDLPQSYKHPLAVSYKLFDKMPYDRQSWDLTAVLYAVEKNADLFDMSDSGVILIDENGNSTFKPTDEGKHYYMIIRDGKHSEIINALVRSVISGKQ